MKKTDWILILSYLVLHVLIGLAYYLNFHNQNFIKEYYLILPFVYAIVLYLSFYNRLWNKQVLQIWSVLGFIQLVIYFLYKDLPELQSPNGNKISSLKAIPITLLTYTILNWINKKLFGDNYIVTSFRFNSDEILEGDGRKLRPMDYIFSFIGFMMIITTLALTP